MSNVIKVDFKNHKRKDNLDLLILPSRFSSNWISSDFKRPYSEVWDSHIKFKVYETDKNFAVQFSIGQNGEGFKTPQCWSNSSPIYKKDINKIWEYIFNKLKSRNVDIEIIKEKIKQESDPEFINNKQKKLNEHWDFLFSRVIK